MRYGLSKPTIAKLNVATGTYSNGFRCGEAMTTAVNPEYNEGAVRGDNKQIDSVKKFKRATVNVGTTRLPLIAENVIFGKETDELTGEVISKSGDQSNYVGYGFISQERVDGVDKHIGCVLLKVLFTEGQDDYETEGDSIVFKTPSLSGIATAVVDNKWRRIRPFDTEQEAQDWIDGILGLVDKCEKPVASIDGGTYAGTQSVTLSCATVGATIKYTTNGLTPSSTVGTTYSAPISVATSTMLKAVAVKTDFANSDVMSEEYTITA